MYSQINANGQPNPTYRPGSPGSANTGGTKRNRISSLFGGGVSVQRASVLQRCLRDIHVARQHAMVGPATLETIGGVLLGVDPIAPLL